MDNTTKRYGHPQPRPAIPALPVRPVATLDELDLAAQREALRRLIRPIVASMLTRATAPPEPEQFRRGPVSMGGPPRAADLGPRNPPVRRQPTRGPEDEHDLARWAAVVLAASTIVITLFVVVAVTAVAGLANR